MRINLLKKDLEKTALFKRLSDGNASLLFFYDEEIGEDIPHEKINAVMTLIHPPYDYRVLEKWLYLGNWQAVFPPNEHYEPFDTFRATESEIQQRMNEARVKLIIDSFHDDIEWNVIEET